jgi:hypothetical protein
VLDDALATLGYTRVTGWSTARDAFEAGAEPIRTVNAST